MARRSRSRRPRILLINSGKKRRHHRRRRRNPGMGSFGATAKSVFAALIPAAIAGGGMGFIDAQFLGDQSIPVRMVAKLAAAGVVGALLRGKRDAAFAAMGAVLGTTVYEAGIRAGGGVIATSKPQGMKQLAAMAGEDRQSMGLLQREFAGMGLLLDARGMHGLGSPVNTGARHAEPDLGGGRGTADDSLAAAIARDWNQ